MAEKLLIIGGGLSGLFLASLLENSYEVTLLEARSRLGGRIFSIDGHDMGPSWIWRHHKHMLDLLKAYHLEIFPQYTTGYALYDTKYKLERFTPPPSVPSVRVKGTLSLLIDKLQQNLSKTTIHLNEQAHSLKDLGDTVQVQTNLTSYTVHKVIVAVPPRLCTKFTFSPELSVQKYEKLMKTPTWMGNSAKCVVQFKTAFWREQGLSGFVFSNLGPLGEIHDASTQQSPSIFGFVNALANMQHFERDVRTQCKRIFGIEDEEIVKIHLVDWRAERFTATKEDAAGLSTHPMYGIDLSHHDHKVLFSATEFSFQEGGYLEGALIRAKEIAKILQIYIQKR